MLSEENQNNSNSRPKIYQHHANMIASNQTEYRFNYLAELLSKQEKTNQTFTKSVSSIHTKLKKNKSEQQRQYSNLIGKLDDQAIITEHLKTEVHLNDLNNKDVIERLYKLEAMSEEVGKVLEEEKFMSQATIDQLSFQEELTRKIHTKLENYESLYLDIQNKMEDQEHFYQQINEKLQVQDIFHQTVMERMDKQDVQTQKIALQLDVMRDHLIEKIESAIHSIELKYKHTLQYLGNLFSRKERITHKFSIKPEKEQHVSEEVKQE